MAYGNLEIIRSTVHCRFVVHCILFVLLRIQQHCIHLWSLLEANPCIHLSVVILGATYLQLILPIIF